MFVGRTLYGMDLISLMTVFVKSEVIHREHEMR